MRIPVGDNTAYIFKLTPPPYHYERQISILQPLDRDLCDCHRDLSLRSAIPAFQQAVQ